MTPDDNQDSPSSLSASEQSPGKILAAARERAGLSQDEVASELYMTLTKVRALENDEFARLHSDTFIRGYLRAYANLLKLDVDEVIAAYDKQAQRLGLVETFVPKAADNSNKKTWLYVVFVGLVLLVLWLISIWFFDNKKEPDYPLPAALVVPQETIGVSISSAAVDAEINAASVAVTAIDVASNTEPQVTESQAPAVSEVISSVAQSASSSRGSDSVENLDELLFVFTEECWLEVSDAQGDVLATQLEPAGSQVTIKGRAPFDVKVGNVQGVSISLNGSPVKVVPVAGTNVRGLKIGN